MSHEPTFIAAHAVRTGKSWWQRLSMILSTLGAGASTVPFGDNGDVFRALADVRAKARGNCAK